jgi:hypothetical protein
VVVIKLFLIVTFTLLPSLIADFRPFLLVEKGNRRFALR